MKIFTIESETNDIMVHASVQDAEAAENAEWFSDEAAMAILAADWPAARLVEIWNSLPGVTPVTKFKDRTTGVSRIWKALQTLGQAEPVTTESETAPVLAQALEVPETPQSLDVASEVAPARTKATPRATLTLDTPSMSTINPARPSGWFG